MDSYPRTQHIIVMGVSGCGKSTIASELAEYLHWTFFDADDFHSNANIQKMKTNTPLDDNDRSAWLKSLSKHLCNMSERGVSTVLACSALKSEYRKTLIQPIIEHKYPSNVSIIHLDVPFKIAKTRLKKRKFHFMSPALLQSQYDTLEIPSNNEPLPTYIVDASSSDIKEIVTQCIKAIS